MTDVVAGVAPKDNLIRARFGSDTMEVRSDDTGHEDTLFGYFSVFDTWAEISSHREGRFLERVASTAFDVAFKNPRNIRVLYEHGADPFIGNKPIGDPTVMRAEERGAYYEADLFDASYVNDLRPALRAGQLGASFRFSIKDDEWVTPRRATEHNPEMLKERTIKSVVLYEFGPVTWGAYPEATAGIRSGTDDFIDNLLHDPKFLARFTERVGLTVVERILSSVVADGSRAEDSTPTDDMAGGLLRVPRTRSQRRAALVLNSIPFKEQS